MTALCESVQIHGCRIPDSSVSCGTVVTSSTAIVIYTTKEF